MGGRVVHWDCKSRETSSRLQISNNRSMDRKSGGFSFYPLYPPEGGLWVPDSELAFSFRIIFLPPEPSPSLSGEGWGGVKILGYLDRE